MQRRRFLCQSAGAFCLCLGSCSPPELSIDGTIASSVKLIISAAASMQDVLEQLQIAYRAVEPTVELVYNFGASGALAQQIMQGAPVDIFLSASPHWLEELDRQGQILANSYRALVQNSMVLVVPKDQRLINAFEDLPKLDRIAIGEPESVPAGSYAKEILISMDLFETLQPSLVFGKNVRHVLSYVETGNVDAALVYATDALLSKQVRVVMNAPNHKPIVYSVAVVNDSAQAAAAQTLISFLLSDRALAIFQEYGFKPGP